MNWFRNMKMTGKLALGFGLLVVLTVMLGLQSLQVVKQMNKIAMANLRNAKGMASIGGAEIEMYTISRLSRDAILNPTAAEVDKRIALVKEADATFKKDFEEYQATLTDPADQADAVKLTEHIKMMRGEQDKYIAMAREGRALEALAYLGTLGGVWKTAADGVSDLRSRKLARINEGAETAAKADKNATATIIIMLAVSIMIAFGVGLFITRLITGALLHVVERATTAATGDLTVRVNVTSKDELGQMGEQLNVMMKTFDENMQQVAQTSQAVASAAQQLGAGAGQISSGAQEQASSLEETAASLEEITSTVKQNADNAQQANQLANGSREVAEKGGRVVSTAVEAMSAINQSSKQIADIIGTIDEIAFQTNLLALNAAVEAARAGEQGRGFAVVATEVRNLAQRSATSAKEIKSLIQDSVRKVEGGTELVNQSGQTLSEIVTSVKRVTDIVAEIAAASREQSTGIDQVNKAITQMDQVTQSNASQTEELNATAEGLAGQAVQLQALVSRFKLSGQTAKASVARAAVKSAAAKPAKRHLGGPVAKAAAPVASAALAKGGDEWEKGFEEY
jgi:methyl-accepting chemotaxis protein